MSCDPLVIARQLSKTYRIYPNPFDRVRQRLFPNGKKYYEEFTAVHRVDLELFPGETVGIVGKNGSGKSTLLKLISGVLTPTSGKLIVNGKVAPLLTIGAGFNSEFTGRENVMLNASILGLSDFEIQERFADIEAFADIGDFIDRPVRNYSSGMYSRLAFAVAIHIEPEILVVDEVLAVGDEAFGRKCFARIEQMRAKGTAILFVSHSVEKVLQLCDRALLMDKGRNLLTGSTKMVVAQYQRLLHSTGSERENIVREIKLLNKELDREGVVSDRTSLGLNFQHDSEGALRGKQKNEIILAPQIPSLSEVVYESKGAWIDNVQICDEQNQLVNCLKKGQKYTISYDVRFDLASSDICLEVNIVLVSGIMLGGYVFPHAGNSSMTVSCGSTYRVQFSFECVLLPGKYFLNVIVKEKNNKILHKRTDALMFDVMQEPRQGNLGIVDFKFQGTIDEVEAKDNSVSAAWMR